MGCTCSFSGLIPGGKGERVAFFLSSDSSTPFGLGVTAGLLSTFKICGLHFARYLAAGALASSSSNISQ